MERVTHHGRETAYRLAGADKSGATALYVHGSGGTHRLWAHQYAPDGPTHPAVALDLSGHGESDDIATESGPETLAAYAADVVAVARETNAEVLVGNSLGGAVVFKILLDTTFDPDAVVFAGSGAKLAVAEELQTALTEDFEAAVDMLHRPSMLFADPDSELLAQSKQTMQAVGQRVTRRDFLSCHTFDVRERLADVAVPTLAVVGDGDRLTPPSYHEYLAENIPDCEQRVIEGAGHLAMLEAPDTFNNALESFLAEYDRVPDESDSYN
ncbi:alpha/beta fold hydrolase [Halovenus salina]|uniref:Alpha/beta fold hydrolase n=1 Tax=Halovenus salina TaxID=1510225 RepID=A0ABD5VZ35_9EURY|nr:alpha/beta fold hydrolase [Halovenus salina]